MKFRKKPVIVEAEQFTRNHLPKGCTGNEESLYCFINTLEGVMKADLGDWIITGVKGEKYPCKPDIFKMTYEKVEEEKFGTTAFFVSGREGEPLMLCALGEDGLLRSHTIFDKDVTRNDITIALNIALGWLKGEYKVFNKEGDKL